MILSRSLTSALALVASLLASPPATAEMTLDPGTSVTFHHHDLLGSPVMVSDHKGRVLWYENTKPYGESLGKKSSSGLGHLDNTVNEATSNLGYTGHTVDSSTGLVYMKARHYDPVIGRFYSNDPVGFKASNPMMFNRYAYANNNPYIYMDPDGRDAIDISYVGYHVDTGFGFSAPLGHGGVVILDETSGHTEYYEYGRYSPNGKGIVGTPLPTKQGNIRKVTIPDVEIGSDGLPTQESLNNLYSYLEKHVGKGAPVDPTYEKDADFQKMKDYIESVANNSERKPYNLLNCNCFGFADDVIEAGSSNNDVFSDWLNGLFGTSNSDN